MSLTVSEVTQQRRAVIQERHPSAELLSAKTSWLSLEVAGQSYGLPIQNIVQIIEMVAISPLPAAPRIVVGVIDFRGQVIPLVDMRRRLHLAHRPYDLRTPIVVCRLNGCRTGLIVDSVSGVIELGLEQVDAPTQIMTAEMALRTHHLAGVARLETGLLLLLDPDTFLFETEEELLGQALPSR